MSLIIKNLSVTVEDKNVIKDLSLTINAGQVHILMGPNGAGKSSLCYTIMGHQNYKVNSGSITFLNQDLLKLKIEERARLGLFLSFQHPIAIPGVSVSHFLRVSHKAYHLADTANSLTPLQFTRFVKEKMKILNMDESFLSRSLNDGFSGGEKKRLEILQLAVLEPKIAILDEFDSGVDVDALKTITSALKILMKADSNLGLLIITHYPNILQLIEPDHVYVMKKGVVVKEGGTELVRAIEEKGYEN